MLSTGKPSRKTWGGKRRKGGGGNSKKERGKSDENSNEMKDESGGGKNSREGKGEEGGLPEVQKSKVEQLLGDHEDGEGFFLLFFSSFLFFSLLSLLSRSLFSSFISSFLFLALQPSRRSLLSHPNGVVDCLEGVCQL